MGASPQLSRVLSGVSRLPRLRDKGQSYQSLNLTLSAPLSQHFGSHYGDFHMPKHNN